MVTAIGRTFVASLSLGSALLLWPGIAETHSPVIGPLPPGWTLYAPASPDDLFMRPDQGDGLIEVTCSPTRKLDLAAHATGWESKTVGPGHLLLTRLSGGVFDLDGDAAYDGVYEGDGVLAKVLFVRISGRVFGFVGYFLRDDFDRGEATLNRLVERFHTTSGDCRSRTTC